MRAQNSDLLPHNKVRWLPKGKVLKCFALCLNEINTLLNEKQITLWWITATLNELNLKLQGKGNPAYV